MSVLKRISEVPSTDVSDGREVVGVTKRVLMGPADAAPTFAVRLFTLAPGGHTAAHRHPFEHGVVVLRGRGTVLTSSGPVGIEAGSVVFVPPGEYHQFRAGEGDPLEFLCVVPLAAERG